MRKIKEIIIKMIETNKKWLFCMFFMLLISFFIPTKYFIAYLALVCIVSFNTAKPLKPITNTNNQSSEVKNKKWLKFFGYYYDCKFKVVRFILEPYFIIKSYINPGGCIFAAYDYEIKQAEVNGKKFSLFAKNLFPHRFFDDKDIHLPIKNQLRMVGFNSVYTEYTDDHFFIDRTNKILYIKDNDVASFGDFATGSRFIRYIHRKHFNKYALEVLNYIDYIGKS